METPASLAAILSKFVLETVGVALVSKSKMGQRWMERKSPNSFQVALHIIEHF